MKFADEYRDPAVARRYLDAIRAAVTRPWTLMEVCGGQTHAIVRFGLDELLPAEITLVHGPGPTPHVLWLPALLALALVTALGVGFWLSALNVQYRDVRHAIPFLTQLWMFATPIAYPSSLLGEPWRTLYGLNPMVGVVEGFRWALLGTSPPGPLFALSAAAALLLLGTGALYFRRMERTFADVV